MGKFDIFKTISKGLKSQEDYSKSQLKSKPSDKRTDDRLQKKVDVVKGFLFK